jgi:hypothetical protein
MAVATTSRQRGRFLVVLVGVDEAHRYVADSDTKEAAEGICAARNKQASELGLSSRYQVIDSEVKP